MFSGHKQPDRSDNDSGDSPFTRWLPGARVLVLLAVALLLWSMFGASSGPPSAALPYSTFVEHVRAGNVAAVEMTGQRVTGEFEEAISPPPDADVTGGPVSSDNVRNFSTTLPQNSHDHLLPLLEEQSVVLVANEDGPSLLASILVSLLPVALLVGLLFFLMRSQMRGQQGMFNFGRSRAKEHSIDRPSVHFEEVAGADEAKRELVEVVDFLKSPERYVQLGAKIPRGVLLVGPPGTGKTLLARAVAGEAGVPFFSTSASEFVELFVGVGASRVRDLFEQARKHAPAIIFIDEVDSIGRQRGAGMGGGHDEREQTLNQILVEMDGFEGNSNVIVIAATNRPDVLDPALLRPGRFDRQITVNLPDVRGRESILKLHMRGKPIGNDIEPATLARQTPGFSGADLANLVNEAALHAARRRSSHIQMEHIAEALDKIVLGTERPLLMSDHDRRVIAYHEAGHALVAYLLPGTDPVNKITIMPRGRALGVTEYLPEGDRVNYSREYLRSMLANLLGGRAAEQVAIGEITTGAENDLQRASQLARNMIGRWGMSDEMGLLFASDEQAHPFLGREMAGPRTHSEATAARLDEAARTLLEERFATAVRLLSSHRDKLDRLSEALLTHETLDRGAVERVLRDEDVVPAPAPDVMPPPAPPNERPPLLPPGVLPA